MNLGKTSRATFHSGFEACTEDEQYAAKLGNNTEGQKTKALKIDH